MRWSTVVLTSALTVLAPTALGADPARAAGATPPFVFSSDRDGDFDIYLATADGQVVQLTRNDVADYDATWSPDGRRLAFVSSRDGDDEVFVMDADGSHVRQLTHNTTDPDGVPAIDATPAWSPDGTAIAFVSTRDGGSGEIYRMNADGTGQTRLTQTPFYVGDHDPVWSPDGRFLAFSSDRAGVFNVEIFRMRADGTAVRRLTRTGEGIDDHPSDYSPDGRRLLMHSNRSGQHDLYVMRADGGPARRLGGDPQLDDVFGRWTPDGSQVLFETFPGPEGEPREDVWIIGSDGSDRRRLTTDPAADTFPDPRPAPRR